MRINPINVRINDLIDEHNKVLPYVNCSGCDTCLEIEQISKQEGLFLGLDEEQAAARERCKKITKEEIGRYINLGYSQKEMSEIIGVSRKAICNRIRKWFPEARRKRVLEERME